MLSKKIYSLIGKQSKNENAGESSETIHLVEQF